MADIERDQTVGGDGAFASWSVAIDDAVIYAYAVDGRERYGAHWDDGFPFDVEVMVMPNDATGETIYEHPFPMAFTTSEKADAAARAVLARYLP